MLTAVATIDNSARSARKPNNLFLINPTSSLDLTALMVAEVFRAPSVAAAVESGRVKLHTFTGPRERRNEPGASTLNTAAGAADLSLAAPQSIANPVDEIQSAWAMFEDMRDDLAGSYWDDVDFNAFLIGAFSDHPLVDMLRHAYPEAITMHLMQAALLQAAATGQKYGIMTTTADQLAVIEDGVRSTLGIVTLAGHRSYVGTMATGVNETGLQRMHPARLTLTLAPSIEELLKRGARSIVLGCTVMPDLEALVGEVQEKMGSPKTKIQLISGLKAGILQLIGLLEST